IWADPRWHLLLGTNVMGAKATPGPGFSNGSGIAPLQRSRRGRPVPERAAHANGRRPARAAQFACRSARATRRTRLIAVADTGISFCLRGHGRRIVLGRWRPLARKQALPEPVLENLPVAIVLPPDQLGPQILAIG